MKRTMILSAAAGGAAGAVNGFFGGGGGLLLVPILQRGLKLETQMALATSTAIILPLCALSAGIYLYRDGFALSAALPYLLGGILGGAVGGRILKRLNAVWLQRCFGLLVLWAGVRAALPG